MTLRLVFYVPHYAEISRFSTQEVIFQILQKYVSTLCVNYDNFVFSVRLQKILPPFLPRAESHKCKEIMMCVIFFSRPYRFFSGQMYLQADSTCEVTTCDTSMALLLTSGKIIRAQMHWHSLRKLYGKSCDESTRPRVSLASTVRPCRAMAKLENRWEKWKELVWRELCCHAIYAACVSPPKLMIVFFSPHKVTFRPKTPCTLTERPRNSQNVWCYLLKVFETCTFFISKSGSLVQNLDLSPTFHVCVSRNEQNLLGLEFLSLR